MGLYLFGSAWPLVAGLAAILSGTGVIALLAHSLRTLFAPCNWAAWTCGLVLACCPCPRRKTPGEAKLDKL
eukprot:4593134-Pyramimonas_sp.AAC.1